MQNRRAKSRTLARHYLIEFSGCDPARVDQVRRVRSVLRGFCDEIGVRVVRTVWHSYAGQGLTVVLILKESHLTYHSWPEAGYCALDLMICTRPRGLASASRRFGAAFGSAQRSIQEVACGPS